MAEEFAFKRGLDQPHLAPFLMLKVFVQLLLACIHTWKVIVLLQMEQYLTQKVIPHMPQEIILTLKD